MEPKPECKLFRDASDKMIAGVCSGLAKYLELDTTLVRIVFLLIAILSGWGFVAYAVLWVTMDYPNKINTNKII